MSPRLLLLLVGAQARTLEAFECRRELRGDAAQLLMQLVAPLRRAIHLSFELGSAALSFELGRAALRGRGGSVRGRRGS